MMYTLFVKYSASTEIANQSRIISVSKLTHANVVSTLRSFHSVNTNIRLEHVEMLDKKDTNEEVKVC